MSTESSGSQPHPVKHGVAVGRGAGGAWFSPPRPLEGPPLGRECHLTLGYRGLRRTLGYETGELDTVYCQQVLEHFQEPEVAALLVEINRVLRPGGMLVVSVPDLAAAALAIVDGYPVDVIADGLRPLDLLYGRPQATTLFQHRTGFTAAMLQSWLGAAGFEGRVDRLSNYHLWAEAYKTH